MVVGQTSMNDRLLVTFDHLFISLFNALFYLYYSVIFNVYLMSGCRTTAFFLALKSIAP